MLFAYKHVEYDHSLWFQFAFDADAPRSLRGMLGAVVTTGAFAIARLLRAPHNGLPALPTAEEQSRALDIARAQGRADAMLVAMGDKQLLFSPSGESFLMFGRRGSSWIALFDPVGRDDERSDLIWQFREHCDRRRVRAAFYQVRPEHLPLYLDAGLTVIKLGEEARVPLSQFSLKGPKRANLRYAIGRAPREGLRFEVVPSNRVAEFAERLRVVSTAWLAQRNVREKAFSMGAFSEAYLAHFDIACVFREEAVVAFASLLRTGRNDEASIDLMRYAPDAPGVTMEFLMASIILTLQEQGVRYFNLGMAPLSGLAQRRLAPLWHRVGALVYEHGEQYYNFHGLRQFKDKFTPLWEPRYLASPGGIDPLVVLADAAALIGGGSLAGVVRK